VGTAHQRTGESFEEAGDTPRAVASYVLAEQEFRRAIARNPENSAFWYDLASLFYLDVAPLRTKGGDPAGALQAYREALSAVAKAAAMEPNNAAHHSDLSLAHQRVGAFLEEQGRQTEASEEYRQAVAAAQTALQLDPKTAGFHDTLATARQHQGDGFLAGNQPSPAIVEYRLAELEFREGIRLDGKSADRWSSLCVLLREHLAPARKKSGDPAAERQALRDALAAIEQAIILAPNEADYRKTRDELQTVLRAPGSN
jgi:tetratricopeptide (TPR) repeat protein